MGHELIDRFISSDLVRFSFGGDGGDKLSFSEDETVRLRSDLADMRRGGGYYVSNGAVVVAITRRGEIVGMGRIFGFGDSLV